MIETYFYCDSLGQPRFNEGIFPEDTLFWRIIESVNENNLIENSNALKHLGAKFHDLDSVMKGDCNAPGFILNPNGIQWLVSEFKGPAFYLDSRVHRTTDSLIYDIDSIVNLNPNLKVLITQIGINDCIPRLVSLENRKRIERMKPLYKKKVLKFLHTFRPMTLRFKKKKRLKSTWVPLVKFESNLLDLKKITEKHNVHLFMINIAPPNEYLMSRSVGAMENIVDYNNVLNSIIGLDNVIDCYSLFINNVDSYLLSDGHHLTKLGSNILANEIALKIKEHGFK